MEAVITIDVLRRAGADVTVASVEKELQVDACHGVKLVADSLINDCAHSVFDLISLPVISVSCSFNPLLYKSALVALRNLFLSFLVCTFRDCYLHASTLEEWIIFLI